MKTHRTLVAVLTVVILIGALMAVGPGAAQTPRRGGVLLAAIAADAPSLDPHQEETFATVELVAPCYSTLLQQVFESRGF
jgi:ABC-type oligopeptide transport system substrate-binding subunit